MTILLSEQNVRFALSLSDRAYMLEKDPSARNLLAAALRAMTS